MYIYDAINLPLPLLKEEISKIDLWIAGNNDTGEGNCNHRF